MSTLNQILFQFVHHFAGRFIILDDLGVFFAVYLPYFIAAAFLLLVWEAGEWRQKIYRFAEGAMAAILARGLIEEIIHLFYYHPRPFDFYGFAPLIAESGWSFPSGHACFFFALAMVAWFAHRKWGAWLFVLAIVNGIARIYTGVHWPFDVLGGAAIGIVSALFIHWLMRGERKALFGNGSEGKAGAPHVA